VRETIVGILTINIPILRPLFNKSFWSTKPFQPVSITHGNQKSSRGVTTDTDIKGHTYEMTGSVKSPSINTGDGGSEEFIIGNNRNGEVLVHTTFEVRRDLESGQLERETWDLGVGGKCKTVVNVVD
jgi:hypothetical protein